MRRSAKILWHVKMRDPAIKWRWLPIDACNFISFLSKFIHDVVTCVKSRCITKTKHVLPTIYSFAWNWSTSTFFAQFERIDTSIWGVLLWNHLFFNLYIFHTSGDELIILNVLFNHISYFSLKWRLWYTKFKCEIPSPASYPEMNLGDSRNIDGTVCTDWIYHGLH